MLMQTTNELELDLVLKTVSPLLIKESRYDRERRDEWARNPEMKKTMPNMIPVSRGSDDNLKRAVTSQDPRKGVEALPFFVPGSSLRGAWRSHLERVLRGISPPEQVRVCDPFEEDDKARESCSNYATHFREAAEKIPPGRGKVVLIPYRLSCPVCKLFGHARQAGRLKIIDGERIKPNEGVIVVRDHVRIDRAKGHAAPGALVKVFGLQDASFETRLQIRNFELWNLQLVTALLSELRRGAVPLGSGKNKGYGRVECITKQVRLTGFGLEKPLDQLLGVAEHSASGAWYQKRYGLTPAEPVPLLSGQWNQVTPWRWERVIDPTEFEETLRQRKLPWGQFSPLADRARPEIQG